MRLDIRYVTTFRYGQPVRESENELRACPATDSRQQLLSYRAHTTPSSRVLSTTDYWGTRVDAFGVRIPHVELEIVAEAVVDTSPVPLLEAAPRMESLRAPEFRDAHVEYLYRTPHTAWGDGIAAAAAQHAGEADDAVIDVVLALYQSVGSLLSYQSGSTYVGVEVEQVLHEQVGVCQDFAHLAIAMCRSIGIPARYVSGYLFTEDDATGADTDADVVDVQTHAWMEVAVPDAGWWPLDPTNSSELGERHVKIGHGRDYADVPPLKGVFSGPSEHELEVGVQMRRMTPLQQAQQQQQ